MNNTKYHNIKLELQLTTNLNNINSLLIDIKKPLYEFVKKDIVLKILADEYELLIYYYFMLLSTRYKDTIKDNKLLEIKSNHLIIYNYILFPIAQYYNYNLLSYLYFYYFTIKNQLPTDITKTVSIIKRIGPMEIKNNKLELYFELEEFLIIQNNFNSTNIKTVFIYIDYGSKQTLPTEYIINSRLKFNNFIVFNVNSDDINIINKFINKSDNIVIDHINLYHNSTCNNEIVSLPLIIYVYNLGLLNLNINGNLYIHIATLNVLFPTIEVLYYIFNSFDKIEILKNSLSITNIGFLKFTNYNHLTNFNSIIEAYLLKDPYIGQNVFIKDLDQHYCNKRNKIRRYPATDLLIKSIFSSEHTINKVFIQFINDMIVEKNNIIILQNLKIDSINIRNVDSILSNNISKCIDFCKNYKIEVSPMYKTFKLFNYDKIIKTYFYKKPNINYDKLLLAIDSSFSITKPEITLKIVTLLKKIFPSVLNIIDGTSNVGTATIVFAYFFKHIYAIEINDDTYKCLKNNILTYNLKNVDVILDDIIIYMKKTKFDINTCCLFLDPPWDGPHYKINNNVNLTLSNIDILDFIKDLNIKYVLLKVPFNYNLIKLYKYFDNVSINKLQGFFAIFIIK